MKKNDLPPGWSNERIQRVLDHYENQSEEDAAAEDEAAFKHSEHAMIAVPTRLVPVVRGLVAEFEASNEQSS